MAEIALGVIVLADGFDLSCYLQSVEFKADVDIKDNTTLCTTNARTYQPGLVAREVNGDGFYAQNAVDDTLSIQKTFDDAFSSTANKLVTIGAKGYAQGYPALMLNTKQAKADVSVKVGELIMTKFNAKATLDGAVASFARGFWLNQANLPTDALNGNPYDNTLTTLTGWFCQAHVTDADGTASFKVQHSADGATWIDLINFGTMAKNTAAQSVNIGTAVRRYLRIFRAGGADHAAGLAARGHPLGRSALA